MYPVTENNELALENKGFCVIATFEIHVQYPVTNKIS